MFCLSTQLKAVFCRTHVFLAPHTKERLKLLQLFSNLQYTRDSLLTKMTHEFLPLCDILFNIISMASYFCDVVFDVVTTYTLFEEEEYIWVGLALTFILSSLITCTTLSVRWALRPREGVEVSRCRSRGIFLVHMIGLGVLWRYFKLFIPVDLRVVKTEVRDLCILRLVHAFIEAAPMLLLQLYLIWLKPSRAEVMDLNVVSTFFSLFSVCWALASFNKNVRRANVHKLVLTWLGVIFQFFWRLGTVTARVIALTVYATVYSYWVFLVIGLHWMSMFFWLISPRNVFHGDKMARLKKDAYCSLIAVIYVFCYVNLQHVNPRIKMFAFYVTMFLENTLLIAVWVIAVHGKEPWYHHWAIAVAFLSFMAGIVFMILYYRYFHVKRLSYAYAAASNGFLPPSQCQACTTGSCREHYAQSGASYVISNHFDSGEKHSHDPDNLNVNGSATKSTANNSSEVNGPPLVPGVFNCRFNPAMMRKKKKPTSFVPPPVPVMPSIGGLNGPATAGVANSGKAATPFWKRPLPPSGSSENEGSISSRFDIQQKLQEKKRQQMAELRVIEEEIKQGKLKRPPPSDVSESGTLRQPIPPAKKQPWPNYGAEPMGFQAYGSHSAHRSKTRSKTPEILLSPHYLEKTRVYDYQDSRWKYGTSYHPDGLGDYDSYRQTLGWEQTSYVNLPAATKAAMYKSYRIPSDIDSQVSLPRSYTLPREFKYKRPKSRKAIIKTEHFIHSTNSSDGDVDSGDENEADLTSSYIEPVFNQYPPLRPSRPRFQSPFTRGVQNHHETKL